MSKLSLTIDGRKVESSSGQTVLEAADAAGIYIPRLCYHRDLKPVDDQVWAEEIHQENRIVAGDIPGDSIGIEAHCGLCLVAASGSSEPIRSCHTPVTEGMVITTGSPEVVSGRKKALSKILATHPHACLTCAQREGCSRVDCSSNVPIPERCCRLLGNCELQKISDYIGIPANTPKYQPPGYPITTDDNFFERDFNLCIGCLRCVRACHDIRKADVLAGTWHDDRAWVGTRTGAGLSEANCRYCGVCVEICPTGALLDKEDGPAVRTEANAPCVASCPAGMDIPRYVRLIAEGRISEAVDVMKAAVPFPEILGYVCFHPCETTCRRGEMDQPISICSLKRYAANGVAANSVAAADSNAPSIKRKPDTGKKVAIIGSGPAGMSAAFYLGSYGHAVTLLDRESEPGGMLRYGIPSYRLPTEVLDREIGELKTLDVEFRMNYEFSPDTSIDKLKSDGFDAILVSVGVSASKVLPIENSNLDGVSSALDFLKGVKTPTYPKLQGRVAVIGGGNVGIDTAMTAIRLGAESVSLTCLESENEMPAHDWEIAQAIEEGVTVHPSLGPKRFTADGGRVSGVELMVCTRLLDDDGKFAPQFDESQSKVMPADHVIVAIGQQVENDLFADSRALERGPGGTLRINSDTMARDDAIFAAGDVTRGPSSVVDALADGRRVANDIDIHLGGSGLSDYVTEKSELTQNCKDIPYDRFIVARNSGEMADPKTRTAGFGLLQATLPDDEARVEAGRCLQCQLRREISSVILPPELWQPLTIEAIASVPNTEGVFQLLDDSKKALRISGVADLKQSLTDCLESPGEAVWFVFEEDPMFTKRESELVQQYLQQYGEMPSGGGDDDLDDLF